IGEADVVTDDVERVRGERRPAAADEQELRGGRQQTRTANAEVGCVPEDAEFDAPEVHARELGERRRLSLYTRLGFCDPLLGRSQLALTSVAPGAQAGHGAGALGVRAATA